MSRKLATLKIVNKIEKIEGADNIELATVDSWKVVVRKNEVSVGSLVVYFEIDSWIPKTLAPFLCKESKKFNDIEGERLRTIKLRGQISQGLIMQILDVAKVVPDFIERVKFEEGTDLTEVLSIQKWELASQQSIGAFKTKGNFPEFIPKTDQERIQNLTKQFEDIKKSTWEVTEKYDGSSMTVYLRNEDSSVCSRNINLKMYTDDENTEVNAYWQIAIRENLLEKLKEIKKDTGLNLALQGEMVGEKICTNIYKLKSRDFWLFDIYDIDNGKYFSPSKRQEFAERYGIKHVPVLFNDYSLVADSIDELLTFAEGPSVLNSNTEREGLVFKNTNENENVKSFKVISNKFLIKTGL